MLKRKKKIKKNMTNTPKNLNRNTHKYFIGAFVIGLFAGVYFITPQVFPLSYSSEEKIASQNSDQETQQIIEDEIPEEIYTATHIVIPEAVKAIYMTQCVAGTPSFRKDLVALTEETEVNSIIIDIKDYSGSLVFRSEHPLLKDNGGGGCRSADIYEFIELLHEKGIYVIGRITVFQDPYYASVHPELAVQSASATGTPWADHKGLSFIDVSSRPFWEYIVAISKESYAIGFDELNYDYIRYPSDGPMSDAIYINDNKAEALEMFFKYLYENVHPIGVKMSADLFGYTTILPDDLGIGQQLERALPYFDFIAPMVYPSHYNKGFAGLANPNSDPHKVVFISMVEGVRRTIASKTTVHTLNGEEIFVDEEVPAYYNDENVFIATSTRKVSSGFYTKEVYDALKLRPWLQDFDYGGNYGAEEVRAQIQATYDSGLTSWMLWAPSNRYTRGALEDAVLGE
jgi:hypothetical protein